jgi:magnesium transporter
MDIQEEVLQRHNLQATLDEINELLNKQELVSGFTARQEAPRQDLLQNLLARQQLAEIERTLARLHPADLAYVLEGLPPERREKVWNLIRPAQRGAVLLELSEAVRDHLISEMKGTDIIGAAEHLDSEQLADLVPSLPRDTVFELLNTLDQKDRAELQTVLAFPPGTVGALMDLDVITVREDVELEVVLRYLRQRKDIPDQTDQLCVVDRDGILKGLLPLRVLLIHDPETLVSEVMTREALAFHTDEAAAEAVSAFERYDLISAPVVNIHHRLVGILRVDEVMDFLNETVHRERLSQVGLSEDEDLFGPVWKSGRNRWTWLGLNLMTAFIASRVVGAFEGTIAQLAALAALMPIVAGVAGNSGNQTVALVIRGLALDQISADNIRRLLFKEIGIGLMNGALWGGVVGLFALVFYWQPPLALVIAVAMMLNLLIGALAGVLFPITLQKLGRDPVMGSSVLLTAMTDSMGFFIFLGLAALFLI